MEWGLGSWICGKRGEGRRAGIRLEPKGYDEGVVQRHAVQARTCVHEDDGRINTGVRF